MTEKIDGNFLKALKSPKNLESPEGIPFGYLNVDSLGNLLVSIAGGFTLPTISTVSKSTVVTIYTVNTGFTGASIGDTIIGILVYDGNSLALDSLTPVWYNATTKALVNVTNTANLSLPSGGGSGGGDASATNQVTQTGLLTDIRTELFDVATQTTLAAINSKLPSTIASAANQATEITRLDSILAKITADPATQTTLAAILAKLSNDPATQTTLSAVLAKLSTISGVVSLDAPTIAALNSAESANYSLETGGNLAAIAGKDFATQATLSAVNGKLPINVASEATLTQLSNQLPPNLGVKAATSSISVVSASDDAVVVTLGDKTDTSASSDTGAFSLISFVKRNMAYWASLILRLPSALTGSGNFAVAINEAIVAGTNIIGRVGINQTTPFASNNVTIFGQVAPINRSGTITTGGTAQQLMAANSTRMGWLIQNTSTTSLWFNEIGGTAVASQPSFELKPGAAYESTLGACGTTAISIIGATTGQQFTAREWSTP